MRTRIEEKKKRWKRGGKAMGSRDGLKKSNNKREETATGGRKDQGRKRVRDKAVESWIGRIDKKKN